MAPRQVKKKILKDLLPQRYALAALGWKNFQGSFDEHDAVPVFNSIVQLMRDLDAVANEIRLRFPEQFK